VRFRGRLRWVVVGLILGAVGLTAGLILWVGSDPWSPRLVIRHPGQSFGFGFTPDSRWLVTSSFSTPTKGQELLYSNLATGEARQRSPEPLIAMLSYADDRQSYVGVKLGDGRPEVVWGDVATGSIRARFSSDPLRPGFPTLEDGGRSIRAFLSDKDRRIKEVVTWDIASGIATRRPFVGPSGAGPKMYPMIATLDGRILVYLDQTNNGVQLWDSVADRPIGGLLRTPTTRISGWPGIVPTPDGKTLIIPRIDGQAEVWDVANARLVKLVAVHSNGFRTVDMAVTPDGRFLASGGYGPPPTSIFSYAWSKVRDLSPMLRWRATTEVVVVDLTTGRRLATFPGSIEPLISPDGRSLVVREWDRSYPVRDIPQPSGR